LNIEKTLQEDRQALLTVEYTSQEFEGFKRRAARKIARDTKIPGFRPGKAPYDVILNRYGENTILQEALDILLDEDYAKILEQAELKPSGAGSLDSIDSYDPPKLTFTVPLEPEVDLREYREIRKEYELEEFNTGEVEKFITNLQRNAATIIPADHPAEETNLVYFNLSGEFLNPDDDEDATITDKTPQQVVIPEKGEESDTEWPFPGFARELLGVKAGDSKEIQHTYPDDYDDAEFQGKTAVFTVEVQSVKELELPEIDEDFVKSMGNYETPEQFRESVEEQLRKDHQENYDNEFFNTLLEEITGNTELNYPPQMLEHEEEHVLEDIKSRLENQNLDFEMYLKLRETDEESFMEEEVRPAAKQRLERSLVVDALIKAEGLKLDQGLLQEKINLVMTEVFYSGNAQEMQKQMGQDEFSRMISMEGVQRTMNSQLKNRLKLIATGQPIPEEQEEPDLEPELASPDAAADEDSIDPADETGNEEGLPDESEENEPSESQSDSESEGDQSENEENTQLETEEVSAEDD